MLKNFFMIILMVLNIVVINKNSTKDFDSNLQNEIMYEAEGDIIYNIQDNELFDSRLAHNQYCDIDILLQKSNPNVTRFNYQFNVVIGSFDYEEDLSTTSFSGVESINFGLLYRPINSGNSHLELTITPIILENGEEREGTTESFNFYCVKEARFLCSSNISLSHVREIAFDYLVDDGLIVNNTQNKEEYVNQEDSVDCINMVDYDSDEYNLIEGYVCIENDKNEYYPAEGIKVILEVTYENGEVIQSNPVYVDENGKYNITFNYTNYEKLELKVLAETQYVKICSNENNIDNSIYSYTLDFTDIVVSPFGKKYFAGDIKTYFSKDRGKAFTYAILFNAAGDYADSLITKTIPRIPIIYPADGTNFSSSSLRIKVQNNKNYTSLLHEYGHYIMNILGVDPNNAGGTHSSVEDLALRYNTFDKENNTYGIDGKGYKMAFGEGFATYFSNLVQKNYNYTHLDSKWGNQYNDYLSFNIDSPGFVLRESNERTVTHVLLTLTDPDFKDEDFVNEAIGVNRFFNILETHNQNINSLSNLLELLSEQENMNMDLINETMAFYRLAPYEGKVEYNNNEIDVVSENNIPTFTWNKGNYIHVSKYYRYYFYEDEEDGKIKQARYTEDDQTTKDGNPTYIEDAGYSNNNFTLYLYNQNGIELLKKENIVDNDITKSTASYTPTKQEWESIFFSNTFYCYWYVEGYDSNNTTNNGSYRYTSEEYAIILEKKYVEYTSSTNNSNISNLTLDVSVQQEYNENVKHLYVNIDYQWDTIPTERMKDYIIMRWSYVYALNGTNYIVNYYNDTETIKTDTYVTQNYVSLGRELYYSIELYELGNLQSPTSLHGNATIELVSSNNNATTFELIVEYHHITNTGAYDSQMNGIISNTSGEYTTAAGFKEIKTLSYTIN